LRELADQLERRGASVEDAVVNGCQTRAVLSALAVTILPFGPNRISAGESA
jgi:hypothetical protein